MPTLNVDNIDIEFPEGWTVTKYDDWGFYRNQFGAVCGGHKAVDVLAYDPQERTVWLLEVKDYRVHPRTKGIDLVDEIALKVRDTIAGLVAASFRGDGQERTYARQALRANHLRVVLYMEQPRVTSKLFARAFDLTTVRQKLRQKIKPIDAHPEVVDGENMHLLW